MGILFTRSDLIERALYLESVSGLSKKFDSNLRRLRPGRLTVGEISQTGIPYVTDTPPAEAEQFTAQFSPGEAASW